MKSDKTMIQCDRMIHRNLKVFCAVNGIISLDKGIQELLNIAHS